MIRFYIIVLVLFVFTGFIKAQQFNGGAILGINASQVDGDTYSGYNKLGMMGGVYVTAPIFPKVDLVMEIKYMGKGAHKKSTETDPTLFTSKFRYMEVPLIVRFLTKTKIDWEAGLGFGYLVSLSEEDENGPVPEEYIPTFKKFELSSVVGIGYKLNKHWTARLRYSYSILPIMDFYKNPTTKFYDKGAYNNLFSIGFSYSFRTY